ncbi:MAG: hypothetical protein ABIJ28_03505 [Patescibacteria group bacterium]
MTMTGFKNKISDFLRSIGQNEFYLRSYEGSCPDWYKKPMPFLSFLDKESRIIFARMVYWNIEEGSPLVEVLIGKDMYGKNETCKVQIEAVVGVFDDLAKFLENLNHITYSCSSSVNFTNHLLSKAERIIANTRSELKECKRAFSK